MLDILQSRTSRSRWWRKCDRLSASDYDLTQSARTIAVSVNKKSFVIRHTSLTTFFIGLCAYLGSYSSRNSDNILYISVECWKIYYL